VTSPASFRFDPCCVSLVLSCGGKGLKRLELVVDLAQSSFELLLELAVFFFQFLNAALFGKDHQVFACIGFACRVGYSFTNHLFSLLVLATWNIRSRNPSFSYERMSQVASTRVSIK
jgi:hypothetical protein